MRTALLTITILVSLFLFSGEIEAFAQNGGDSCAGADYAAALEEFTALAEEGDPFAQFLLGLMYAEGKGVQQDFVSAYFWLSLSVEQGNPDAVEFLADVMGKMTADQLVVAEEFKNTRW
jgi:TPR repeat protein